MPDARGVPAHQRRAIGRGLGRQHLVELLLLRPQGRNVPEGNRHLRPAPIPRLGEDRRVVDDEPPRRRRTRSDSLQHGRDVGVTERHVAGRAGDRCGRPGGDGNYEHGQEGKQPAPVPSQRAHFHMHSSLLQREWTSANIPGFDQGHAGEPGSLGLATTPADMRRIHTTSLLAALAAVTLVAALAGCGSDESGQDDGGGEVTAPTATEVSIPPPTSPIPTTTTPTNTAGGGGKKKPAQTTTTTGGSAAPCSVPEGYQG